MGRNRCRAASMAAATGSIPARSAPWSEKLFRIFIFLGIHHTKLTLDLVLAMHSLQDRCSYAVLDAAGRNALDFHLAYYLGVLVNVISNLASLSLISHRTRPEEAIASAVTHANSHSTSGDRASSSSRS